MAIIWVGTGRFSAYIGPVQDYIDRVVAADVAAGNTLGLEVGVRDAYDVFIRDSINVGDLGTSGGVLSQANSIIKAAPIMAGARTLAGALVPLVGVAPTRFGTEGGWNYNRKTGTAGNGTNNYLNTGRNNNADPQNDFHMSVHVSATGTGGYYLGSNVLVSGSSMIVNDTPSTRDKWNSRSPSADQLTLNTHNIIGFKGSTRNNGSTFSVRTNGATVAPTTIGGGVLTSATPESSQIYVFARNGTGGTPGAFLSNTGRLAFYSIGESLNLALLDARVTALINAIAAAIP